MMTLTNAALGTARCAISGNTFPVKDQLKALGGRWDVDRRVWTVPVARATEAQALVTAASRPRPVTTSRPSRRHDHEDCLSLGPCGPDCAYADLLRRR